MPRLALVLVAIGGCGESPAESPAAAVDAFVQVDATEIREHGCFDVPAATAASVLRFAFGPTVALVHDGSGGTGILFADARAPLPFEIADGPFILGPMSASNDILLIADQSDAEGGALRVTPSDPPMVTPLFQQSTFSTIAMVERNTTTVLASGINNPLAVVQADGTVTRGQAGICYEVAWNDAGFFCAEYERIVAGANPVDALAPAWDYPLGYHTVALQSQTHDAVVGIYNPTTDHSILTLVSTQGQGNVLFAGTGRIEDATTYADGAVISLRESDEVRIIHITNQGTQQTLAGGIDVLAKIPGSYPIRVGWDGCRVYFMSASPVGPLSSTTRPW